MRNLHEILETLRNLKFLQAQISVSNNSLRNIEILSNGKRFTENFINLWNATSSETNSQIVTQNENDVAKDSSRFKFVNEKLFQNQLMQIGCLPAIVKTQYVDEINAEKEVSKLIIDNYFHSSCGLSKFYNIQRERKIWWMRYSANPSRYFLEPYINEETSHFPSAQSITIKARFPFGNVDLERISLVHLNEIPFPSHIKEELEIFDKTTGQKQVPSVIRSVIDVKDAVSGLLLDACDHNRDYALLLNRKLSPYQCAIACFHQGNSLLDLKDLYKHLSYSLKSAGLRVLIDSQCFQPYENFSSDYKQIRKSLQRADSLGIPYTLLIDEKSLENGILKLRSRDTTLKEAIHISDIPKYLMQIFKS